MMRKVVLGGLVVMVLSACAAGQEGYEDASVSVSINYFDRFVRDGGMITWCILIPLSIATIALGLQFGLTLRRTVQLPAGRFEALRGQLAGGQVQRALQGSSQGQSLLEALLHPALSELPNGYDAAEYALAEAGEQRSATLLRKIEYLNIIGTVAPMIGLFGTVYGIILAFNKLVEVVRHGGVTQPDQLAEGISVALVTTLWGLIVAIPAMALYGYFRNRIEALCAEAVLAVQQLLRVAARSGKLGQSSSSSGKGPEAIHPPSPLPAQAGRLAAEGSAQVGKVDDR